MCMISRWMFSCCDREYWTWKPKSCEIPGKRCVRPDRWYMSITIRKVNVGPCWRCEDERIQQQVFGDRNGRKRAIESGEGRTSERSSSDWHSTETVEVEDKPRDVINPNLQSRSRSQIGQDPRSSSQYEPKPRAHQSGSTFNIEISQDPSAQESTLKSSVDITSHQTSSQKRRKHTRSGWTPVNALAKASSAEQVQGKQQKHTYAASIVDVNENEGKGVLQQKETITDFIKASTIGSALPQENQIVEQSAQSQTQITQRDESSEWFHNNQLAQAHNEQFESLLNPLSPYPPLSDDSKHDEPGFSEVPVSDLDSFLALETPKDMKQ